MSSKNLSVPSADEDNDAKTKLEDYRLLGKLGEGTFSEVLKVRNRKTGKVYAMKRFRKHFKSSAEIENLREIQALRRVAPHPNIIELHEVIFEPTTGTLSLTFDLMLMNLYEYISQRPSTAGTRSAPDGLSESLIKHFTSHLLTALEHIHNRGIFHRDIKPENILLTPFIPPALPVLKLSDFGSCRGIHSKPPYTSYIATRWYRPPECLLGNGTYGAPMDIWGVGCVIFEMTKGQPLFPGGNEVDMLFRIHGVVGTPKGETVKKIVGSKSSSKPPQKYSFPPKTGTGIRPLLPDAPQALIDLMTQMLIYEPKERITAREARDMDFVRDAKTHQKEKSHAPRQSARRQHAHIEQPKAGVTLPQLPPGQSTIESSAHLPHISHLQKTGSLSHAPSNPSVNLPPLHQTHKEKTKTKLAKTNSLHKLPPIVPASAQPDGQPLRLPAIGIKRNTIYDNRNSNAGAGASMRRSKGW